MIAEQNGPTLTFGSGDAGTVLLAIPYLTQRPYDQLCWAACCAMLLSADGLPGGSVTEVAVRVTGQTCGNDPELSPCNIAVDPEAALKLLRLPYSAPAPQAPIAAASINDQLGNARKPIEVFWQYRNTAQPQGHVALVAGYDVASQTWCVFDPWLGASWQTYDYLMSYGAMADWIESFYGIGAPLGLRSTSS